MTKTARERNKFHFRVTPEQAHAVHILASLEDNANVSKVLQTALDAHLERNAARIEAARPYYEAAQASREQGRLAVKAVADADVPTIMD